MNPLIFSNQKVVKLFFGSKINAIRFIDHLSKFRPVQLVVCVVPYSGASPHFNLNKKNSLI